MYSLTFSLTVWVYGRSASPVNKDVCISVNAPSHPSSDKQPPSVTDVRAPGICTRTSSPNIARQHPPAAHEPPDIMRLNTRIPRHWYAKWRGNVHSHEIWCCTYYGSFLLVIGPANRRASDPTPSAHALQLSYSVARAEAVSVSFIYKQTDYNMVTWNRENDPLIIQIFFLAYLFALALPQKQYKKKKFEYIV